MSWVKVDDQMARHPKWLRLGKDRLACQGLWLDAMCYASSYLTDGFVPEAALERGTERLQTLLVDVGLWVRVGGGYEIHDFHDYQPSRAETLERRAIRAAAGRAGGIVSGKRRRTTREATTEANGQATDEANASPTVQPMTKQTRTPARPVPVPMTDLSLSGESSDRARDGVTPIEERLSRLLAPRAPTPAQLQAIEEDWVSELGVERVVQVLDEVIEQAPPTAQYGALTSALKAAKVRPRRAGANGVSPRGFSYDEAMAARQEAAP